MTHIDERNRCADYIEEYSSRLRAGPQGTGSVNHIQHPEEVRSATALILLAIAGTIRAGVADFDAPSKGEAA